MVVKTAASGSSGSVGGKTEDGSTRPLRPLAGAAIAVAVIYGSVTGWLFLADSRFAGEPVVHVALAPEEPAPPAEQETGAVEPDVTAEADAPPALPATPAAPETLNPEALTPEERALLEAAENLDKGVDEDIISEVRIVGAESVSGNGAQEG
ncbi:MAG TPA: hypothetical protein DHK64_01215, partial [Rhodobiaceae bacterium]|nr:hypothetical protein [Rhodobiaceae bacterium]